MACAVTALTRDSIEGVITYNGGSGSGNTLRDILKGEYKDWAPVILRSIDLQKFPLKWATLLGLENECVFFSDHNRQRISAQ